MIRATAAIGISLLLGGVALAVASLVGESHGQQDVICYSGGHMIWYDVCDECYMGPGGGVHGVNSEGVKFEVSGDCVLAPVDYEPGVKR